MMCSETTRAGTPCKRKANGPDQVCGTHRRSLALKGTSESQVKFTKAAVWKWMKKCGFDREYLERSRREWRQIQKFGWHKSQEEIDRLEQEGRLDEWRLLDLRCLYDAMQPDFMSRY